MRTDSQQGASWAHTRLRGLVACGLAGLVLALGASRAATAQPAVDPVALARALRASTDPALGALHVARALDPSVDVAGVERALAQAGEALKARLRQCADDPARIGALTQAVHHTLGLEVEPDASLEFATVNVFPHQVLTRKRGACLGLSLIYLSLGQRAGLRLSGVSLPGHFFVRFHGQADVNLEPTLGGAPRPEAWFRKQTGLPERGDQGNYLQDLPLTGVLAEVLNAAGGELVRDGQSERALAFLRVACELAPQDPDARYNLAHALRETGRADAARTQVKRSLAAYRSKEASNLLGLLQLEARRPDLAEASFGFAIEKDPGEARYWNNRGSARCSMGFLPKGIADFDQALALRPGWAQALRNRGLARLEHGRVEGAAKDLLAARGDSVPWGKLFARLPSSAEAGRSLRALAGAFGSERKAAVAALFAAGQRLQAASQHREARAVYDRVLSLGGDAVGAYCGRGYACEGLGDELWAKRNYYLATQADGRDPRGYKYMAHYYLRRDRYAVAADYFRQYLQRAPREAPDRAEIQALVDEIGAAQDE